MVPLDSVLKKNNRKKKIEAKKSSKVNTHENSAIKFRRQISFLNSAFHDVPEEFYWRTCDVRRKRACDILETKRQQKSQTLQNVKDYMQKEGTQNCFMLK